MMRTGGTVTAMGFLLGPISPVIGAVTGLMMSVVYSPRLMQKLSSEVRNPKTKAKLKRAWAQAKATFDEAAKLGVPVSRWVQEMVTLEQALERLANAEFQTRMAEPPVAQSSWPGDLPTPTDEEQDSILKTTAGIPIGQ